MASAPHTLIVGMGPRLGVAAARRFGEAGHRIGMIARSGDRLSGYQEDLSGVGIDAQFAPADVSDGAALHDAIEKLVFANGTPAVVICNPYAPSFGRVSSVSSAAVRDAVGIAAAGAVTIIQSVLPAMRERGGGAIVLISSAVALDPGPNDAIEAAAMAAARAVVLSAARDHDRDGLHFAVLTVNAEPRPGTPFEPARIADALWDLSQEPSGAWTRERVFSGQLA